MGVSPSGAKTDAIDATVLARYGLHELDWLRRLKPDSPIIQELKAPRIHTQHPSHSDDRGIMVTETTRW